MAAVAKFSPKVYLTNVADWKAEQEHISQLEGTLFYVAEINPTQYPAVAVMNLQSFAGQDSNKGLAKADVYEVIFVYLSDFKVSETMAPPVEKKVVKPIKKQQRPAFVAREKILVRHHPTQNPIKRK